MRDEKRQRVLITRLLELARIKKGTMKLLTLLCWHLNSKNQHTYSERESL